MSAKNGKPCRKCGGDERHKGGHCKKCKRDYEVATRDKINERRRNRSAASREKAKKSFHKWRAANRDKANESRRTYYAANRDKERESGRAYYAANRDKICENSRNYNIANRDKRREYERQRYAANPDKILANTHHRRARKTAAGGSYTAAEWKELCEQYDNHCCYPGCERTDLQPDHVIPVAKGGSSDISNIQPLCSHHNYSKGTGTNDYRTKPGLLRWIQQKLF